MNKLLIFKSSEIFDDSNLIDRIRQSCIDMNISTNEDEIHDFLKEAIEFLENDLSTDIVNELFPAIISCFAHLSDHIPDEIENLMKKSRVNANYIIVTSSLIFYLKQNNHQFLTQKCNSFVDDALNEIELQIKGKSDQSLKVFNHVISPLFTNDLILNLILSSNLTKGLFSNLFPYIFYQNIFSNNSKFDLLVQNLSISGFIKILPQTELSNQEICKFIINKDFDLIPQMSENALSLIVTTFFYIKNGGETYYEGISEVILQFSAVLMILAEKIKKECSISLEKYKDNIANSIQMLEYNNSPVLNASIDFILNNFKFVSKQPIIFDDMFHIFFILTKLLCKKYNADKMLLLENIFLLTNYDNYEMVSIFFNEFAFDLLIFIIQNMDEIKKHDAFKRKKMNLMYINSSIIIDIISSLSETNDIIKFVYFIESLCCNQPIVPSSKQISENLMKAIHQKIKEESWDDVLLIGEFMKKNDFCIELFELNELNMPKHIKCTLFNFIQNTDQDNNDDVDHILYNILSDPNLGQVDSSLKKLFDIMMKDKEICKSYLTYLILSYAFKSFRVNSLTINGLLKLFKKEYEQYKDEFIDVVNKIFYANQKEYKFVSKDGFMTSFQTSEFGQSIIFKLFDSIKRKTGNYEAFICLKSISSTFPFLFDNIFDKVCDIVSEEMNNFEIILKNNENEEDLRYFKSYFAAFSFFISICESNYFFDQFIQWFFSNMLTLNDCQLASFLFIMNYLTQTGITTIIFNVWIIRLNILEKVGKLLERKFTVNSYYNYYKKNIYSFLLKIYQQFEKINNYEMIQIDEYLNQIENPLNYFCDFTFKQISTFKVSYYESEIHYEGLQDQFIKFLQNLPQQCDFWIEYCRHLQVLEEPNSDEINEFCKKLNQFEPLTDLNDIQNIPSNMSVKMVRSLVLKQAPIYSYILYKTEHPFVEENKKELSDIIKNLIDIQNHRNENPDDVDNIDISLFDSYNYLFPQYCQQTLFKNLVKELTNPLLNNECYSLLLNLIQTISVNDISYVSFLEFISQYFTELYEKCNESNMTSSINAMIKLIDSLKFLSQIEGFKQNFVDLCGKNILNIVLAPKLRSNSNILKKMAELFLILENDLPIRVTQLICCMLSNNNIDLNTTFKLILKFDFQNLGNVKHYILCKFDNEIKKMQLSQLFIKFAESFPLIINERKETMFSLLDNLLHKYFDLNENNDITIQNIGLLFDILSPTKKEINNLLTKNNKSSIIQQIKEKSPSFWNLYEKYSNKIMELIENNPILLNNFKFFCEYPEFTSFKIRSSFFRKKMKSRINEYSRLTFKIDRQNILLTSFKSFFNKPKDQLLNRFNINFNGEQSIDEGGPTREWFTILSKEIFNQNYGLFECSRSTKCYQPNQFSDVNPNHIEYFKFAGKFIALALIQGQCIDAHFSTSFLKQILKCELNYKDVEDFDDELYKNLDWMLNNDVDSLCMFFEVDTKELGMLKTISLKENGSEIEVTNENKNEYVNLRASYALKIPIENQVRAFCEGFYSLIDYDDIKIFTPKELDLLICGIPEINVKDFIENTTIDYPYNSDTPVIKYFFDAISKWENEKLAKLLLFMTGSSRVPSNGFKEFCEMTGSPLKISSGGDKTRIPQSHTCFNTICLPKYESEEELNEKLILAIDECNTYEMS